MGVVKQLSLELFGKVAKNPPAHPYNSIWTLGTAHLIGGSL